MSEWDRSNPSVYGKDEEQKHSVRAAFEKMHPQDRLIVETLGKKRERKPKEYVAYFRRYYREVAQTAYPIRVVAKNRKEAERLARERLKELDDNFEMEWNFWQGEQINKKDILDILEEAQ